MLDALKTLFENNVVSAEIKESIEQAWNQRIVENREIVSQQLREEFARKYEHDKNTMVDAVDRMISEQLSSELSEFVDDRRQLAEMKVKFARKMSESATTVNKFVTRQLAQEVKELHEDQMSMVNKFGVMEHFVVEALAQEIAEFYKDKKDVAESKVRLIREGRQEIKRVKQEFVKRAAVMVERVVGQTLNTEITSLKEDIESARRTDFGRKLFEAFASEYQSSYLNEKSETAKLLKVIDMKDLAINEAANAVVNAEKILESKHAEIVALKESQERKAIMGELLAPLNAEQRAIMGELMTSVKTLKLNESFEKYLPAVISGKQAPQKRQALVEAKEITGNKDVSTTTRSSDDESNIIDIRRLAGL